MTRPAPMSRAEQRDQTREGILAAAVHEFAQRGYDGTTTRTIAARAGVTQGLLTYHFPSKDALWRAAADQIFQTVRTEIIGPLAESDESDPRALGREAIRAYVRFAAARPEVLRFMVDAQDDDTDGRRAWLAETHLRPFYRGFLDRIESLHLELPAQLLPHLYYTMVGAGSLIFSIGDEVATVCGLDVTQRDAVEAHADLLARLMVP